MLEVELLLGTKGIINPYDIQFLNFSHVKFYYEGMLKMIEKNNAIN